MVHLRDQHDAGAVDGDAAQHRRLGEGVELALKQQGRAAIAGPERAEQQEEAGKLAHPRPVRGHETHDGEAEENGTQHRQGGSGAEERRALIEVPADGPSPGGGHPTRGLPARQIALELVRYQDMDLVAALPPRGPPVA
jgi:hypothetical protein